jgi:AraC-like DNA-binding protein
MQAPEPVVDLVQVADMRFKTQDLDEARELVSQVYCDHHLSSVSGRVDAFHYHLPIHGISLNYMSYGPEAIIEPGYLTDFYLIQLPLRGTACIEADGKLIDTYPGKAVVIDPKAYTRMVWSEGCEQFLVQISKDLVNRMSAQCLGEKQTPETRFVDCMDHRDGNHHAWWRHLFNFIREYNQQNSVYQVGDIARITVESLVKSLLYQVENNHTQLLYDKQQNVLPKHVKIAQDFMHKHFSEHLVVKDLVEMLEISERSLFEGFRKFSNTTPMKFLLTVRLNEAQRCLSDPDCKHSVTEVALRCGFTQLGRFSHLYREMFGELPSETTKRYRGG